MENSKIRLDNPNKFNVGIITPEKQYGQNIAPGAFIYVSNDELEYLMSTTNLLQRGILRVHGEQKKEVEERLNIDSENNANFMSDEDIRKKLSVNANQLKKWLNGDIEPFVLERIADIAKTMNLSMSKVQVLQDRIPNYEFIQK